MMNRTRSSMVIVVFTLLIATVAMGQTYIGSISISEAENWTLAGSPYILQGTPQVTEGGVLTIDPGVVVRFESGMHLGIMGRIIAEDVTFTSAADTTGGSPAPGDWNSIWFGSGNNWGIGHGYLTNCEFKYGGCSAASTDGIIALNWAVVELNNCEISHAINNGISSHKSIDSLAVNSTEIHHVNYPLYFSYANYFRTDNNNNFHDNAHEHVLIWNTAVNHDAYLPQINQVYYCNYGLNVGTSFELTIEKGNILKFRDGYELLVNGRLQINGTETEPVKFTSYHDDNLGGDTNADGTASGPAPGNWAGIRLHDTDSTTVISNAEIYYTGNAIRIESGNPVVDSTEIRITSQDGFQLSAATRATLSNNTIGTVARVPVAMTLDCLPMLDNNSFSSSDNAYDVIGILTTTITNQAHLIQRNFTDIPNVTYQTLGNITINEGASLTIDPGIVLKFGGGNWMNVYGKLTADGTVSDPIVLTEYRDDNHGNPGDSNKDGNQTVPSTNSWQGIMFFPTADVTSSLTHCLIKYAGRGGVSAGSSGWVSGGAVTFYQTGGTLDHCIIQNANHGVAMINDADPVIHNTSFENIESTPIALSSASLPDLSNNTILNAGYTAIGLQGANIYFDGVISQRSFAGYDNLTYLLLRDMNIQSGTYVTVDPGVVIKMQGRIHVYGGFKVEGQSGARVVFTSAHDDNAGNPGDTNGNGNATTPNIGNWAGILYWSTADDVFNSIEYCDIKYSGGDTYTYYGIHREAALFYENAGGSVTHTNLINGHIGIICEGQSDPYFSNVQIQSGSSDPIEMSLVANPTFEEITFVANASNGIAIREGTLTVDATLEQRSLAGIDNIAYIMRNETTISESATLTIYPGVVIKPVGTSLTVNGALQAIGEPDNPVVFTSFYDDSKGGDTNNDGNVTVPGAGNWYRIIFNASARDSSNMLKNCLIRYGGYTEAIQISSAYAEIDSNYIEFINGAGIGIYGSANPDITNNQITGFSTFPIRMHMFSEPNFEGNIAINGNITALGIEGETYARDDTIPVRSFGGYENITYYLESNHCMRINSGTTITVPAGIAFKKNRYSHYRHIPFFDVYGGLVINGTAEAPVTFTCLEDDECGNPADTQMNGSLSSPSASNTNPAIRFYDESSDSSLINHTLVRYSGDYAGIILEQASPTIENCTFEKGTRGIDITGVSAPILRNNTFHDLNTVPFKTSILSWPAIAEENHITGHTFRGIQIKDETLNQDYTLIPRSFGGIENIPYYIEGSLNVGTSAVLTMDPGVICKFRSGGFLRIHRGLNIRGSSDPDSAVVLTSMVDDFYGGDMNADSNATQPGVSWEGNWGGVVFYDDAYDALCTIDNAVITWAWDNYAIRTENASPTITNTVISKTRNGIWANGASNPVINGCAIYDNRDWGVYNEHQAFVIDATGNWWGTNDGPTHDGNPGGTGDAVSDGVDYSGFSTSGTFRPVLGDVSLNGDIQAFDASLILRHVVELDTLSDLQLSVADVSGDGSTSAYDASYILRYVVGLIEGFPSAGDLERPAPQLAAHITSTDRVAEAGSSIQLPVYLEGIAGSYSLELALDYDASTLQINSVQCFELEERSLLVNLDQAAGRITLASAGLTPLDVTQLELLLEVTIDDDAPEITSALVVESFIVDEVSLLDGAVLSNVDIEALPETWALKTPWPNPFNPIVNIPFDVPAAGGHVRLEIFNVRGQRIHMLVDADLNGGQYTHTWNGRDALGHPVGSGVYLLRMQAEEFVETNKIILMK